MTVVVLAARQDRSARSLVANLRSLGTDAALMLPSDLGRRGWHLDSTSQVQQCVVSGRTISQTAINGVVTRLVSVSASELEQLHPEDRDYAAAEMQAFLLYWLDGLVCPVLNRPHPGCLAGPAWSPNEWLAFASRMKCPVISVRQVASLGVHTQTAREPSPEGSEAIVVEFVAGSTLGTEDPSLREMAVRLAEAARVDLLRVRFVHNGVTGESRIASIDPWINVQSLPAATAIARRCSP